MVSVDVYQKRVFHIASFRSRSHQLKSFRCSEVSKRVSKRKIGKMHIFVESILQKFKLEIPIIIYKLIRQISLWISVSYGSCEFNIVAIWNKGKNFILVDHHLKCTNWIYWFHIQPKSMPNVNMYVRKSNF